MRKESSRRGSFEIGSKVKIFHYPVGRRPGGVGIKVETASLPRLDVLRRRGQIEAKGAGSAVVPVYLPVVDTDIPLGLGLRPVRTRPDMNAP